MSREGSHRGRGRGREDAPCKVEVATRELSRAAHCYSRENLLGQGANSMSKMRVAGFSISLDGYGAGPNQRLEHPLGENGMDLHQWLFDTRTFRKMHGGEGGRVGVDEDFAARSMASTGAWILGRNMFGPVRGPWPDESFLARLVGRGAAVPRARLRLDAPCATPARNEGR